MKIFDHFQHITLTSDQHNALGELESFLEGNGKVFLLQGYAGTGKTTLLKGIASYLSSQGKTPHLVAPTGRAAMILRYKTGLEASTIHRSIYNLKEINEKQEGTSFKYFYGIRPNQHTTQTIYLIDEASMISDVYSDDEFIRFGSGYLLKDLFDFAFTGENNRKIVFIGDTAQLPPVGMNHSPALDRDYLLEKYTIVSSHYKLTEVVRQKADSNILSAATHLRNSISKNQFNEFNLKTNKTDLMECSPFEFIGKYREIAKKLTVTNTIVICHSNRQALEYNHQIRTTRFGEKSQKLQKEDILMITHNNYNYPVELFNGMFVRVTEVGEIIYRANPKFYLEGKKTVSRQLDFRELQVEVFDIYGKLQVLKTTVLDNFLTAETGKLHPYDQRALYVDFKDRMGKKGIKPRTEEFIKALKTDTYFNAIQAKYGYAITCHKAQGGEWDAVFVDFQVFIGKMTKAYFRWAYTAITRSSSVLYCIDAPSFNAFNQFMLKDVEFIKTPMPGMLRVPESSDFIAYRLEKIQELAKEKGYDLLVKKPNFQLDLTFKKGEKSARVQLWYGKEGFKNTTWINFTDQEFKVEVNQLLRESMIPNDLAFTPRFEFQMGLHGYVTEILKEQDLILTNIVQKEWSDQYFIQTDAHCALIEFFFDKKHKYTYASPKSTSQNDIHLLNVVNRPGGDTT